MKRISTLFFLFFISFFAVSAASAEVFTIPTFKSDITIHDDGTFRVQETIVTDFSEQRHGIFRDIPVNYYIDHEIAGINTRAKKRILVDVISVTDQNLQPIPYEVSKEGQDIRVKIGDPDAYILGEQIYVITYDVDRALLFTEDHDELYWNITGDRWPTTIDTIFASVTFDGDVVQNPLINCFSGEFGSTAGNCSSEQIANRVDYKANGSLTIVYGFDKGLIDEPSSSQQFLWFLQDNAGFGLPVVVFIMMFTLWYKKGRDPKRRGTVRQYDSPDELSPSEVGMLVGNFKPDLVSAELVYLAHKGYINIKEILVHDGWISDQYDYELSKVKEYDAHLKPHQQALLEEIFETKDSINVSELETSFYVSIKKVQRLIEEQLQDRNYFTTHPSKVRAGYVTGSIVFLIAGVVLSSALTFSASFYIGFVLSAIIIFAFGWYMPQMTLAGVRALEHAEGFEVYLEHAEQYRVRWEEDQNLFFEFLPYAMVFGIADKYAKAFKDMYQEMPDWYQGANMNAFTTTNFVNSMSSFSSSSKSHFVATAPSSSSGGGYSGGFSGGGFGGGGGGSW